MLHIARAHLRISLPISIAAAIGVAWFYSLPLFWGGVCAPLSIPEGLLTILIPGLPVKALVAWAQIAWIKKRGVGMLARTTGTAAVIRFVFVLYLIDFSISVVLGALLFPLLLMLMFFFALIPLTFLLFPCALVTGLLLARCFSARVPEAEKRA